MNGKQKLFRIFLMLWAIVGASVVPAEASVQPDGVHIQILHTNDLQARIEPGAADGKGIGIPEIAGVFWAARDAEEDTLIFDAGDALHGTPLIDDTRGDAMVGLMNLAGYDAMAVGDDDYAYGLEPLLELRKRANFSVLSANTVYKKSGKLVFRAYKVFDCSGVKVGVFGLTTPETEELAASANVMDVAFLDPVVCAKAMTALLRDDGCSVVIGLMHMGLDDANGVTAQKIAEQVPGIDVIIDGHGMAGLPEGVAAGDSLICQAEEHGRSIGSLELVVQDGKVVKKTAHLIDRAAARTIAPKPDQGAEQAWKAIRKAGRKK